MPRSSYTPFPSMLATLSQPPVPSLNDSGKVNFEASDPADVYAQRYRQLLPPHPSIFKPRRPAPPPPTVNPALPRDNSPSESGRPVHMRPLTEIGRHTSPSPKGHARNASNASNASKRTRRSLPKIEEVPDFDTDKDSIDSGNLSRSSSSSSNASISAHHTSGMPPHCTSEVSEEYMKMDRREAAIRVSMERSSWMIDEEARKGKGSRDLAEHINYVISAWQRER